MFNRAKRLKTAFDFSRQPGLALIKRPAAAANVYPLVSIITPYYNAGEFFEQTYRSVINQTFENFEWIIADDGTNEKDSLEILKRLAYADARIRVIRKSNGGIASAQNAGIKEARSEYILTLDADDLIEPQYIEKLYEAMERRPECAWAYTDSVGFQDKEYLWSKPFSAALTREINWLLKTALIRKQALFTAGLYCEASKHINEDWHMWLKMLSLSMRPLRIVWYGCWYRVRDTGVRTLVRKNKTAREINRRLIRETAAFADNSVEAVTIGEGAAAFKDKLLIFAAKTAFGRLIIRVLKKL